MRDDGDLVHLPGGVGGRGVDLRHVDQDSEVAGASPVEIDGLHVIVSLSQGLVGNGGCNS